MRNRTGEIRKPITLPLLQVRRIQESQHLQVLQALMEQSELRKGLQQYSNIPISRCPLHKLLRTTDRHDSLEPCVPPAQLSCSLQRRFRRPTFSSILEDSSGEGEEQNEAIESETAEERARNNKKTSRLRNVSYGKRKILAGGMIGVMVTEVLDQAFLQDWQAGFGETSK
jgi:hypothetical protein